MNTITINGIDIGDEQIKGGSITLANSMIMDELTADEAEFTIISGDEDALFDSNLEQLFDSNNEALLTSDSFGINIDLNSVPYGTPIIYTQDTKPPITFYVKEVKQISSKAWTVKAQSAIGLLINQEYNGGIYLASAGDTVKSVIDDILSGLSITYTIEAAIQTTQVSGWLPVASCRDNLQQICFAFGISVLKTPSGGLEFKYNVPDTPSSTIAVGRMYLGGTKNYLSPASRVTVYEHSYFPVTTAVRKTVFDNTDELSAAANQKIIFENPVIVSTLATTGSITISSAEPNYAIVSGKGTITGVEYSHSTKILTEVISDSSNVEGKDIIYKDATLVNPLNSVNCLKRVADYYSQAFENQIDFVVDTERTGDLVAYTDPFTAQSKAGMLKDMDMAISGILKARAKITENWLPRYLGNNFSNVIRFTSGSTWTSSFTGPVRIVLGGAGNGGDSGTDGTDGQMGDVFNDGPSAGGNAGLKGSGGAPGKVNVIDTTVTAGTTYHFSIGTPGAAGHNGPGGAGTDTTFESYSSAAGAIPQNGFAEVLTGDLYSLYGTEGIDGAPGGAGNIEGSSAYGGSLNYNGVTYTGGISGANYYHPIRNAFARGGGGSGAVAGRNGNPGNNGEGPTLNLPNTFTPGKGADAPTPDPPTGLVPLGSGGLGGNGGSGGGGGAVAKGFGSEDYTASYGGLGSKGSDGLAGGSGYILIYH